MPTSARKSVDVWLALPLILGGFSESETSMDNAIAELEHSDRICQINLYCTTTSQVETLCTAMQVPFPELAVLFLSFRGLSYRPVFPDSLLDGSAPRLQYLSLTSISFPGIPKLLLSATQLVCLWLQDIPHSGYISPEAMATCLSMLTSLESFRLGFESPQSCPDQENRRSPPPTRFILSPLVTFSFKGVNEYLEDLVSRIDAPRLYQLWTTFFNDIDFDTPELIQFIRRTPTFGTYDNAYLNFHSREALVMLQPQPMPDHGEIVVSISCQASDWQLSSLTQICTFFLPYLLTIENLYIHENLYSPPDWKDVVEKADWMDILLPFIGVKNLYISKQFAPLIAPALQDLTGARTIEVLPALKNILLEGFQPSEPVQEGIAQFITARQLTNHHVVISVWDRDLLSEKVWEADEYFSR